MQALQAITGLVLTAYVGLLVAVWKQQDINLSALNGIISLVPVVLFVASLTLIVIKAVIYRGSEIVPGDLESAVEAYDRALEARRNQLILPGLLAMLGLPTALGALLFLIERG